MDFAKNILGKYGWKEGDGLGREKQGIKRPIKANLKFDQAGLGADASTEFSNNWWERAFNDAAENVKVKKQDNGDVSVDIKDAENSVEITTKGYSMKKLKESGLMYGQSFMSEDAALNSIAVTECKALTDEELFRACGGRTAHKGARHGLKLSGKLERLQKQEEELLAKMQAKISAKNSCDSTQAFREVIRNETIPADKSSKRKHKDKGKDNHSSKIIQTEAENAAQEIVNSPLKRNETDASPPKRKKTNLIADDIQETSNDLNEEHQLSKSNKLKKKKKKRHPETNH